MGRGYLRGGEGWCEDAKYTYFQLKEGVGSPQPLMGVEDLMDKQECPGGKIESRL